MRLLLTALAVLVACPVAAAEHDFAVVTLTAGGQVQGLLLKEEESGIDLRMLIAAKNGRMRAAKVRYETARIAKVERSDPIAEYPAKAKAAGSDAVALAALAAWCRDRFLDDEARTHARAAVAADPANTEAVAVLGSLGLFLVDGEWLDERELHARGLIERDGAIVAADAAKEQDRTARAKAATDAASRSANDKQAAVEKAQAELAALETATREAVSGRDKALKERTAAAQAETAAQRDVDAAEARMTAARATNDRAKIADAQAGIDAARTLLRRSREVREKSDKTLGERDRAVLESDEEKLERARKRLERAREALSGKSAKE
ncbi:MAG TPA: hypothetical protein VEL07_20045 [Planctomycetota bacterium]|nr:hypothetical protein [Planctomycetota bacterium]